MHIQQGNQIHYNIQTTKAFKTFSQDQNIGIYTITTDNTIAHSILLPHIRAEKKEQKTNSLGLKGNLGLETQNISRFCKHLELLQMFLTIPKEHWFDPG